MSVQRTNWFDEKYTLRETPPSIEDISNLVGGLLPNLPDRFQTAAMATFKAYLYELEQRKPYSPSIHATAHSLLRTIFDLGIGKPLERHELLERYKRALKKHHDQHLRFGSVD